MAAPFEHIVGRVCREFPCFSPAQAIEALENDAGSLIARIVEYRAYETAYHAYKNVPPGTKDEDRPKGPLIEKVKEQVFAKAQARIDAIRAREAAKAAEVNTP